MKKSILPAVVAFAAALSTAAPVAEAQEEGKEAFLANDCNRCHAVESEGIEATARSRRVRGPDLSGIGEKRDADWLEKYIEKEVQANDRDHPVAWKGGDEALQAIATWLASLE